MNRRLALPMGASFLLVVSAAVAGPTTLEKAPAGKLVKSDPAPAPAPHTAVLNSEVAAQLHGTIAEPPADSGFVRENLAVVGLTSDAQCHVNVTLKNQGAALPASVSTVEYSMKRDAPAADLKAQLPADKLRNPGSIATVAFPGINTDYSSKANFTASVQSNVRDHRTGAAGSTLTHALQCGATPPALDFQVAFKSDCSKTLIVRNTGGPIPRGGMSPDFYVTRKIDGWSYRPIVNSLTPTSGLGTGETWTYPDWIKSFESQEYRMTAQYGWGSATASSSIPPQCRGPKPDFKVDLVTIDTDPTCHVVVGVKNVGTVPVPSNLQVPVLIQRNSESIDTEYAYSETGIPVGNQANARSNFTLGIPNATIKIWLDLPSGKLGPKVLQMNCQK